jgi:catechol 2,3-dioxygenase-like lactoylglutathione lyase family enzyme
MALLGSAGVHATGPAATDSRRKVSATSCEARPSGCYINLFEMSAITQLVAGVPVSDLDASIDWYTRFFGWAPDLRVGDEVLWDIDEHATLFIEPNTAQAGAGRITFAVDGLDGLLERLAGERIEHEGIETYSNGVRHVNIPDPDGNRIAFAEAPGAPSA